jgi:hypothetical protein
MTAQWPSGGLKRILARELRYPVLIICRDRPFHIWHNSESPRYQEGLFVDNEGLTGNRFSSLSKISDRKSCGW